MTIADDFPALSPDVEQGIYRIAQEAIQNAVNHATAKKLTVGLNFADGKTTLLVSDDGTGFDPGRKDNSNHFGLSGMEERAKLIGGELLIASSPGRGAIVKLTV
jgi:two-component system NarL family sensor kinase